MSYSGSYCCCKSLTKNHLRRSWLIWLIHRGSQIIEGSHASNSRQELKKRPWRNRAYWLAPKGLLSLLSYRTQDHLPGVGGTTNNALDYASSILNPQSSIDHQSRKLLMGLPTDNLMKTCSQLRFVFSDNSSLIKTNKHDHLSSTPHPCPKHNPNSHYILAVYCTVISQYLPAWNILIWVSRVAAIILPQ